MIAEAALQGYMDDLDRVDPVDRLDELAQRGTAVGVTIDELITLPPTDQLPAEYAARFWLEVNPTYRKLFSTPWRRNVPAVLDDLADLVTHFETVTGDEAMNIFSSDLFHHLTAEMIGAGRSVTLTIADVKTEKLQAGKKTQEKPVMSFRERDKTLVLNKTNARALAAVLGPETDHWRGARVTLTTETVEAFGQMVLAIRVGNVTPPAPPAVKNGQTRPAPVDLPAPVMVDAEAF